MLQTPDNNRIQKFRSGERNGTTVAVSGASGTIFTFLSRPADVVVDGDGYLFIVDYGTINRVVGSDANGFQVHCRLY